MPPKTPIAVHEHRGATRFGLRAARPIDSQAGLFGACPPWYPGFLTMTEAGLRFRRLPRHVGIIMDGNGRWARSQGLPRWAGHERGADAVRTVVRAARKIGLNALTLFAFSSQNWERPPQEVFRLMELLRRYLMQERSEILDNGIRLVTVGDTERLPKYVREPLDELIAASASNSDMTLCLALSYGGREMIAKAARKMCKAALSGTLNADEITPEVVEGYLDSSRCLPTLDLLIRTSGERRISNFLLWETAYAELYFTETLWPEFSREDLEAALVDFARRERRFGMTSEQVAEPMAEPIPSPGLSPSPDARDPSAA